MFSKYWLFLLTAILLIALLRTGILMIRTWLTMANKYIQIANCKASKSESYIRKKELNLPTFSEMRNIKDLKKYFFKIIFQRPF